MYGENEPPPILTLPLRMKKMLVIGESQELHPASLFPMIKNTTTSINTRARLVEA